MELNELFKDLLDDEGELPIEALPEATEKMANRLRLSGKEASPATVYRVEQQHQKYVVQSIWFQIIELKTELLALLEAVQQIANIESTPIEYDPDKDFEGMMAALEFDKMKRLYQAVMGE